MEEVIHKLSLALLSHDCEPYVFAPYVRGKDNRMAAPYKILRFSRPSSRRIGLRQLLIPLLWHHMRYRFDVLHCHGVYPTGYIGASFNKITGVPFIITPHGGDLAKDRTGNIISRRVMSRINKALPAAQAITAISQSVKRQILDLGAPSGNICLIPNGVSLNEFKPGGSSLKHNYIVFIGRLVKLKGVDTLIEAYSLLKKSYPGVNLKIAGDGVEMSVLKELVRKLNLAREVEFLGTVRGAEKIRLLSEALFLVCPSREEAFSVVNLEALASGLPVIASRVGGITDVIQDCINGFLVEPENPEQLAEKMRLLMEDAGLRQQMSERALHSAARFDWSNVACQYLHIYRQIILR